MYRTERIKKEKSHALVMHGIFLVIRSMNYSSSSFEAKSRTFFLLACMRS